MLYAYLAQALIFFLVHRELTCGSFNPVCLALRSFDDSVHLDHVGDPRGQSCDEVGIPCVGNLNLGTVWNTGFDFLSIWNACWQTQEGK